MTRKNFPFWSIRLKNRGAPRIDSRTGDIRAVRNADYHQSAPRILAYTGCTKLHDQATGIMYDYRKKDHLVHSYVAVPKGCSWAADRGSCANAIMAREKHPRARIGRGVIASCPQGMRRDLFVGVCIAYANVVAIKYNTAVYLDIHDAHRKDSGKEDSGKEDSGKEDSGKEEFMHNLHAHYFVPTREVLPSGFGAKIRQLDIKTRSPHEIEELRKAWAECLDKGFSMQGDDMKMEHRSYARQGIKRKPQPKLGKAHSMAQRGVNSERMELYLAVKNQNEIYDKLIGLRSDEEMSINYVNGIMNTPIPKHCIGRDVFDDHVNQRCVITTYVSALKTLNWTNERWPDEPCLTGFREDFSLLLDRPRPEEEKIPDLPKDPTVEDVFLALFHRISALELRTRPRPQNSRKYTRAIEQSAPAQSQREIDC